VDPGIELFRRIRGLSDPLVRRGSSELGAIRRHRERSDRVARNACSACPGEFPAPTGARKALELSLREAQALGHDYIGTEHLLLGLLDEGEVAGQVLVQAGVEPAVRARVMELLSGRPPERS